MKYIITCCMLFVVVLGAAQNDTIQVAKNYQTLLFFDSEVNYSPLGNSLDFLLITETGGEYNSRIIKLTQNIASSKKDLCTNLNVITADGNSYDFILKTVKVPNRMSIKVPITAASFNLNGSLTPSENVVIGDVVELNSAPIGAVKVVEEQKHLYGLGAKFVGDNEKNITEIDTRLSKLDSLYVTNRKEYFKNRCYYHQFDKASIGRVFSRSGDVFLWIENVFYERDHLFFQFRLENKQSIDFDVNFSNFLLATNYKKKATNQETPIESVFRYKLPNKVKGNTENTFMAVFEKFSLDKKMVFRVDIKEANGARSLYLDLPPDIVNNPVKFDWDKRKGS